MDLDSDFKNLILINRYKFIKFLQKGSYGKVFKALDLTTNKFVSIKSIPIEFSKVANHEIEMLKKLKGNDNICQLLDNFRLRSIYIVLEFCNFDLFEYSKTHTFSSTDIFNIAKQLFNAISYCHGRNIYHRDLKPENILINTVTNQIKLCDWGLSTTKRINNEFNVGTEKYMAPEVFINNYTSLNLKYYDAKYVDYWSFGLTLITLLFGKSPFKSIKSKDKSSLINDSNYKKFVLFNEKQILFDIYPNLNNIGYRIFLNLFKINGIDDSLGFMNKIKQRNLKKFMVDLENNYKFGLTLDEEEFDLDSNYSYSSSLNYSPTLTYSPKFSPKLPSHSHSNSFKKKDIKIIENEINVDDFTNLNWFDY